MAEALPWTRESTEYWTWSDGFEREDLGVGFLEARHSDAAPGTDDWLRHIQLPLFARAGDAEPSVWISDGFWVPATDPSQRRPFTYRGTVETSYEYSSFIVKEARDDGWIQLHVDIGPLDQRGISWGYMWTHTCFLEDGTVPLRLRTWEEFFSSFGLPLTFRDGSRHALRDGAGTQHSRTEWIEGDDEVEILEVRGDWARVRVSRPGQYLTGCLGADWDGELFEGWIQWRSPEVGPWLWYPTRGC